MDSQTKLYWSSNFCLFTLKLHVALNVFGPLQYPIIPLNRDVTNRFPANLARLKVWVRPPIFFHSSHFGAIFEYRRGVGAFYHVPKSLA